MELLYKGHIGTLETVLYIEVVLNSYTVVPLYKGHIGWKLSSIVNYRRFS